MAFISHSSPATPATTLAELALPAPHALAQPFAENAHVICRNVLSPALAKRMRSRALDLVAQRAAKIDQRSAEHVLRYRVVPGDVVRDEWPELFALYESATVRDWVARVTGASAIYNSRNLRSAVNINAMGEPGEVYRWHTDAAGFTLLLYLSDSAESDGGELELRPPHATEVVSFRPAAGAIVLMDGTRCEHRAAPILRPHERISIPMVFTTRPDDTRPAGLDDYLYSS
jgi:hypothetical protein